MGSDLERRDLERLAYGKPGDRVDAAAAQDALRRLVADDAMTAAEADRDELATEPVAGADPGSATEPEPSTDEATTDPQRRLRRRSLIAAGVFILVFAIGFGLGRVMPGTASHPPDPAATLFARFAPSTTFHRQPVASSKAALALLAGPQTAADLTAPVLTGSLGIEKRSLHRILQVKGGLTLWAGKTTSAICLMFTGGNPAPVGTGASCATPKQFDQGGLEIAENGYSWTWDGTTFATTPGTVVRGP